MPSKGSKARRAQLSEARRRRLEPQPEVPAVVPEEPEPEPAVLEQETAPADSAASLEDMIPVQESASKRKLSMFSDSGSGAEGSGKSYFIVDAQLLQSLFEPLACPTCFNNSLQLQVCESKNLGFVRKMQVSCTSCKEEDTISSSCSSTLLEDRSYDLNRRVVAASLVVGLGPEALSKFCEVMALPTLHHKTYTNHVDYICSRLPSFKEALVDKAVEKVREVHNTADGVVDIDVSYDGSWQTRGHKSMSGLGCVIECKTGLVVDYHTMSRYCYTCDTTGKTLKQKADEEKEKANQGNGDEEKYLAWVATHQPVCQKNHDGTAGSMEQAGAVELWRRSLQNGMRYKSVLCDGDANTIRQIHALDPYQGLKVEKRECINHVAKRVGKGLRTLVSDRKKQGVTLGGRGVGQLTEKKMVRLQNYYRKAVLSNHDVDSMRKAIWATIKHCTSTDEEPKHQDCPVGVRSYCFYQRALARNETPDKHDSSTYLNSKVAAEMEPLYQRLTDEDLLRGCLLGKTQNANESIHSVIWAKCPKHLFVRKQRLDIGVSLGVAEFNMGSLGTRLFISSIGLASGKCTADLGHRRDQRRVRLAEKAASNTAKCRRNIIRNAMAEEQQRLQALEGGPQYVPGGF